MYLNFSKEVAQLSMTELNRNGIGLKVIRTFPSAYQAGKYTGIDYEAIRDCIDGKIPSAGGYKWCYV